MKNIATEISLTGTAASGGCKGLSRKLRFGAAALALMIASGGAVDASGRILDRINLGDPESEARRNLEAQGSELMDYSLIEELDVYIAEVTASSYPGGHRPVNAIDGNPDTRWTAFGGDQWLEYRLSEPVLLDSVSFQGWDDRSFRFEIRVRVDGGDWREVYEGQWEGGSEMKEYRFEEVEADQIRIVCHGDHRGSNVIVDSRLGSLDWPDAYRAASYHKALGEKGRRLLARGVVGPELEGDDWMGGFLEFDLQVDPGMQNYITVKVWGSETSDGTLCMMMGRENDDDPFRWITSGHPFNVHYPFKSLWISASARGWAGSPPYPGRWIYRTYALPYEEVTRGREQVRLRIQRTERADKGGPSPTLYTIYSHNTPHFTPPEDEPQGEPFEWGPARGKPENFEQTLRDEAESVIERIITNEQKGDLQGLAEIYHTEWSDYYREEKLIHWAGERLDSLARRFAREGSPRTRWAGAGRNDAWPYTRLHQGFEELGLLEEEIDLEGEKVTRREAYVRMFKGEFDAFHKRRRTFTNQTFYGNAGLYYLNRALLELKPEVALSEAEARWFVYEIFGMVPFGPDMDDRREWWKRSMESGFPRTVMTDAGLTRELGYVAGYGEMSVSFAKLADHVGCPLLKERVTQTMRARSHFRVPCNTEDGYRIIRGAPAVFAHRRRGYPREPHYGHGDAIVEAAILQDPLVVRKAELGLEHDTPNRIIPHNRSDTIIRRVNDYRTLKTLPSSDRRLPSEKGQAPYAWADEGNGVFMIRNNGEYIYGGLYWTPGTFAVNHKGVFFHRTPLNDRIVDIKLDARAPEGETRPITDPGWRGLSMPDGHESVIADREVTIVPPPPGTEWPSGREPRKGRAWFYQANYGDYLIGMNTTKKDYYSASLYELDVPEEHRGKTAKDLVTGREVNLSEPVIIGPRSTMVLYVGDE